MAMSEIAVMPHARNHAEGMQSMLCCHMRGERENTQQRNAAIGQIIIEITVAATGTGMI